MEQTPSHFALNNAATALGRFWAALWSRFGLFGAGLDPEIVISDWVSGIFRRLEELLVQHQAGDLVACDGAADRGYGTEKSRQICFSHAVPLRVVEADGCARDGGMTCASLAVSAVVVADYGDTDAVNGRHIMSGESVQTLPEAGPVFGINHRAARCRRPVGRFLAKMA